MKATTKAKAAAGRSKARRAARPAVSDGIFSTRGEAAVRQMAADGILRPQAAGGLGLYAGQLRYSGTDATGRPSDEMFAWGCYHGHHGKAAALACAEAQERRLRRAV